VKNRYAFKMIKENTLEVYNRMTISTKKIVKPKEKKSGRRELPVEPVVEVSESVPELAPEVEEEEAVELPQEDIPFAELIGEFEPESQSALPPPVEKKKRARKPKEESIPTSSQVEEEIKKEINCLFKQQLPELLGQLGEDSVSLLNNCFLTCNVELTHPEPPASESGPIYNEDKSKVFNPLTKRWCKVDSKAGKKVVVV
jgi:hypothetical protein